MSNNKASMVIESPTLRRHRTTGYRLNHIDRSLQRSTSVLWEEEFETQMRAYTLSRKIAAMYKKENIKTRVKVIEFIERSIMWLLFNPELMLNVEAKSSGIISRTLNAVTKWLDDNGYVEYFSGCPHKLGYIKSGMLATEKLLTLGVDKHD